MTVTLKREYEYQLCNDPQRKKRLETAVSNAAGIATRLEFRFDEATRIPAPQAVQRLSRAQQMRILEQHPLVRKVSEMFDGEIVDFNYVDKSNPGPP